MREALAMRARQLQPGDVLLYEGRGLFSRVIQVKTWHRISHVEVAIGQGEAVASRDQIGVGRYPVRLDDLRHVLRPTIPFDHAAAMAWFEGQACGQPYGWLDLLQFVGVPANGPGIVCSPFATAFLRAGGVHLFNEEPAEKIAPFQFLLSERLVDVTSTLKEAV